jgi:hypothetical protein
MASLEGGKWSKQIRTMKWRGRRSRRTWGSCTVSARSPVGRLRRRPGGVLISNLRSAR